MIKKMTLSKLERLLLDACDIMRTEIESSEFKKYIFAMIFLKRLSDQFNVEQKRIRQKYVSKNEKFIVGELEEPINYDFFVAKNARWSEIKDVKSNVGNTLNKALEALEDNNTEKLEGVLKHINFNEKIGNKSLSDNLLINLITHFNTILLTDENFEFPDLLGSAYEYLIKYFADDAGKKGGEFYTAGEVVKLLANIIEPQENMSILDPTVGSGGMLIQSKQFVDENGGDSRRITLYGQEVKGATWSICKMNMLLHNINSANIKQGDTLVDPQHITHGELTRFDRVIANPPFSQNYVKKDLPTAYNTRFEFGYPPEKKKADLMFLQHMISVLNDHGKMACVMPHGVLFRGGEEQTIRKGIIEAGILEAVIGLPPNLFYGTGIPACVLVINKQGKETRDEILFINADKEFKDGKNQNSLRPEDIQKIVNVYRRKQTIDKYSKSVKISDLDDFNLNIRRYVDNSDDAPMHDVTAHLYGGIPKTEVLGKADICSSHGLDILKLYNIKNDKYYTFIADTKETLKTEIMANTPSLRIKNNFENKLKEFWNVGVKQLEKLPQNKNLSQIKSILMSEFKKAYENQTMLDEYKIEGIFAGFWYNAYADLKSVENSGWNADLIPDEFIVMSQFPEVINQKFQNNESISNLEAQYEQMMQEGSDEDEGTNRIKDLKEDKKRLAGELKEANKNLRAVEKSLKEATKAGEKGKYKENLEKVVAKAQNDRKNIAEYYNMVVIELEKFTEIEDRIKELKVEIRIIDKKMGEIADKAREKIKDDEAKTIILDQFYRQLENELNSYIDDHYIYMQKQIEVLWDKYNTPLETLIKERDSQTRVLSNYLAELGYEL